MTRPVDLLAVFLAMGEELGDSPTVTQLSKRLRISTDKLSSRLETLAINGYLRREMQPVGKRRVRVRYYLTKQGMQHVEQRRWPGRVPDDVGPQTQHGGL